MRLPIGISDFRSLIEYKDPYGAPYLFVDKSLLVKELLDDSAHVILITRPRRFGKTLNMSLLHHFFAPTVRNKPTKSLFENLKISEHPHHMKYQGQYPVIFLTFKDIKSNNFESAYHDVQALIKKAYKEHEHVITASQILSESDKKDYQHLLMAPLSEADMKTSLHDLTYYLDKVYGVKPIVLIDEYDTPIQTAYVNKYYEEMVGFMREFLGSGLKDNPYLERAVLTGILKVSKESLFSGLNHLKSYTLLHHRYGEFFGFTEQEVKDLLAKTNLTNTFQEVTAWYNGYQAGNIVIYNPWSIINYLQEQGAFSPYWVNTSDNALLKTLLIQSSVNFKTQFAELFQGKTVEKFISENFVFEYLDANENALWALLLMAGYLKITSIRADGQGSLCQLAIPNKEVRDLYKAFIAEWLSGVNDAVIFNHFLSEFLQGNMTHFEERLQSILLETCSIHDVSGKNPEKFYHGFMLGLFSGIDPEKYTIESNKESGLGRYDLLLAPKDPKQIGIIIEIKSIEKNDAQALQKAAAEALNQIETQKYDKTTLLQHVTRCLKIGVAFAGKQLAVKYKS